ncbi:Glucose-1-phosphate cytidylyltransferase [compost metagenome]
MNISELVKQHQLHGRLATVTTVQPSGRFGALDIAPNNEVKGFQEKPKGDGAWINAGFFVLQPDIFNYIGGDETFFEKEPLEGLARDGELFGYKHDGFWQPMDTMRDKNLLEDLWGSGKAPWKIWDAESVKTQ